MKNLDLPTSRNYLDEFIKRTILPARQKRSNTIFFLPGTGRTSLMRYITDRREVLEKELNIKFGNLTWLLVDTQNEEILISDWLRTIRKQKRKIPKARTSSLDQILEFLVDELRQRVLLCPLMSEEGISVTRLESLRRIKSPIIDFQFSFAREIKVEKMKNHLGNLAQFGLQSIWFMPFYTTEGIEAIIQNQIRQGFTKAKLKQKEKIIGLSGGYPRLVRFFLRNPEKLNTASWQEIEVKHFFNEIWDCLSEDSQQWLFKLISSKKAKLPLPGNYLVETRLIQRKNDHWRFFSPLFKNYIEFLAKSMPPQVTEKEGIISVSGKNIDLILSSQETKIFKLLWQKRNHIVSRDEIALILWGNNWYEKYSNWAIDQLMARIRRKLGDRTEQNLIKTIRGKGFTINS